MTRADPERREIEIMWLPKDERRLLEGYYVKIGEPGKEKWFEVPSWIPVIESLRVKRSARGVKGYGQSDQKASEHDKLDPKDPAKSMREWIKRTSRVHIANAALQARKLIGLHDHQSQAEVKGISLTIEGYDLGRKYSSWWTWSGEGFAEYKNHWIWLIVSFAGGIIVALLVNWLSG